LTRPFDRHLDEDEIDALLFSAQRETREAEISETYLREIQSHVESCEFCVRKARMHKDTQSEIDRLRVTHPVHAGPDCPHDESEWLNLAAGLQPEEKSKDLMRHAAECDHCGSLLREAMALLADDSAVEEERALAAWSSPPQADQKGLVEELRKQNEMPGFAPPRERWLMRFWHWPRLALAAGALVLVATAGWVGMRVFHPVSADELLARAYEENRTLEIRIPGAQFAPMQTQRGADEASFEKSEHLLKAELLIAEHLAKTPNDPEWLDDKGRAEMLTGKFEQAIHSLEQANAAQPSSAVILTDLGSAYYMHAESSGKAADYARAISEFTLALKVSPDDRLALFNRALAYRKTGCFRREVQDWGDYLRIDREGDWTTFARQQKEEAEKILAGKNKSLNEPLMKPEEFSPDRPATLATDDRLDERVEEYLRVAIEDWLPRAFPASSAQGSRLHLAALQSLARVTVEHHEDFWLRDLLSASGSQVFGKAVESLSEAERANTQGDYSAAQRLAHQAVEQFKAAGNRAGELRASAEEVYDDHLLYQGPECVGLLKTLDMSVESSRYAWIQAQLSLERSVCADLVGDLGTYQSAIDEGMRIAQDHHYSGLYLRGLGFQSQAAASLGDANSGFALALEGLRLFWAGHTERMKGYNLYTDLDTAADSLDLPYFQVAIWDEATELIDSHPDVVQRAMAHRWYANAAYVADMPSLARLEFSKASALFAAAPQTVATVRDHMDAEIWLAELEVRVGDVGNAEARLQAIAPNLANAPNFTGELRYYDALTKLGMRHGDRNATESALRSSLYLAEWALHSFPADVERRRWADETQETYRNLVEWRLQQGDGAGALELWEWYRGAEFRDSQQSFPRVIADMEGSAPPDIRQAPAIPEPTFVSEQRRMAQGETRVAYAVFSDGIEVWAYDDRGVVSQWIAGAPSGARELARHFEEECSDPLSDLSMLRSTANQLYRLLVTPIEGDLVRGRTLLFEADDFLSRIPWEALVDNQGRYLVEDGPVASTPGLYQALHLRPSVPITSDARALIVSVPASPEEGLPPLVDVNAEAEAVSHGFSKSTWLRGTEADLAAIRRSMGGAQVFHFAGHAISSPMRTGLVLAERDNSSGRARLVDDKSLTSAEMGQLQLAVLSACNTGAAVQTGSPATSGLVQTLLRGGVPHVVVSRWNVDSNQTTNFMKQFYERLLGGENAAQSMYATQRWLAMQPGSGHPYYWSAFALQGAN